MPSPFAAAMRAADRSILRTFGEAVRIEPRRGTAPGRPAEMKAAVADTDRAAKTVKGVYTKRGEAGPGRLDGARRGEAIRTLTTMAAVPARVWFSADALAEIGYPLQADDRIVLADRAGEPAFTIAQFEPSDVDDGAYPLMNA